MIHPETQIVNQAVALLIAAATDAGDRVYPHRRTNFRKEELPAIGVYMLEMDATTRDDAPRAYRHEAVMVCELWKISGPVQDDVADPIKQLEWQVIQALAYERYLASEMECLDNFQLTGATRQLDPSGSRTTGESLVSFLATYNSETQTADVGVEPFEAARTTYNPDGTTDPGDQPTDVVELEGLQP